MISFILPATDKDAVSRLDTSLDQLGIEFELIPIYEANSFFDAWKKGVKKAKGKYLILTHQDTEYYYIPDLDEIFAFEENLGMVGVAGSTVLDQSEPWWFSQRRYAANQLSGQIYHHGEDSKGLSVFGEYGIVRVLDGVCLITPKATLEKVGIPGLDWCSWDWYDHVICQEYIKKNYILKTIPVIMSHGSAGGDKRESFYKGQKEFVKSYL